MAVYTDVPIPFHYSDNVVTSLNYNIPSFLGVHRGYPASNATWTLPAIIEFMPGATLYVCNNSAFNIVVNAAAGDTIINSGTSVTVAAGITQQFLTTDLRQWQLVTPASSAPPPPPPVNVVQPCRVGTTSDFSADPGFISVSYVAPGTFTLTPASTAMIDGVTINVGDRVLVKDQTVTVQNGIFSATAITPNLVLARTTDTLYCNIIIGINVGTLGQQSSYSLVTTNPVLGGFSAIVWIKNNVLTNVAGTFGGWDITPVLPIGGSTVYGSLCHVAGTGQVYFGQSNGNVLNGNANVLVGSGMNFHLGATNTIVGSTNTAPLAATSTLMGNNNTVASGGININIFGSSNTITSTTSSDVNVFGNNNTLDAADNYVFGSSNTVGTSTNGLVVGGSNTLTGSAGGMVVGTGSSATSSSGAVLIGTSVVVASSTNPIVIAGVATSLSGNSSATVVGNSNILAPSTTNVCIFGGGNTTSSNTNVVVGVGNTAGGVASLVVGVGNSASSTGLAVVGQSNTVSGSADSYVFGGNNVVGTSAGSLVLGAMMNVSSSAAGLFIGNDITATGSGGAIVVSSSAITVAVDTNLTLVGNNCSVGAVLSGVTVFGEGNTAAANNDTIFGVGNTVSSVGYVVGAGNTVSTSDGTVVMGATNAVTGSAAAIVVGDGNGITSSPSAIVAGPTVNLSSVTGGVVLATGAFTATTQTNLVMVGSATVPSSSANNNLVGASNVSGGNRNALFGFSNVSSGADVVSVGNSNSASSTNVVYGYGNTSTASGAAIFGSGNTVGSIGAAIYGVGNAVSTSAAATIIGNGVTVTGSPNIIAVANVTTTLGSIIDGVIIGNSMTIGAGTLITSVGFKNTTTGGNNIVYGGNNTSLGTNMTIIGNANDAESNSDTVVGFGNTVTTSVGANVFGNTNTAAGSTSAIIVGQSVSLTTCLNSTVVSGTGLTMSGNTNLTVLGGSNAISVGVSNITVAGTSNTAVGTSSTVFGFSNAAGGASGNVICGFSNAAGATNSLVFGSGMTNNIASSVLVGAGGVTWLAANAVGVTSATGAQSGFYYNMPANTKNPAGNGYAMTTTDVAPDALIVAQSVTAGNETWTLPTAAALFAAFVLNAVGTSFTFKIRNQSVTSWIILAANTGVSFGLQAANLVPVATTVELKVTLTALTPTYVVQQVNAAPSVENTGNNLIIGPSTTVASGVTESVIVGDGASSAANNAVVIGQGASVTGGSSTNAIVVGKNGVASAAGALVLGNGMTNSLTNTALMGAGGTSWFAASSTGVSSGLSSQSGFYSNQPAITKNPAGTPYTMTTTDVSPGSLIVAQSVTAAGETWTLPAASLIAAVFTPTVVGSSFTFTIRNQSASAAITLAAGTGSTFGLESSDVVSASSVSVYKVTMTALTPTYTFQLVSNTSGLSTENFNVSSPNTVVNPTASVNSTTYQITAASGTTTGTLANGPSNGFIKNITVDQAVTPLTLTITNFANRYGAVGSYTITFYQAGQSYSFLWDSTAGAWSVHGFSQPPSASRYAVTVFLDPVTNSIVRAVDSDYQVISTGTNVNTSSSTTVSVLAAAASFLNTKYGGGDIFIKSGTYYLAGAPLWQITQNNITVRGEAETIIAGNNPGAFIIEVIGKSDVAFYNLQFAYIAGFSPSSVISGNTFGNQYAFIITTTSTRITIRDCKMTQLMFAAFCTNVSNVVIDRCEIVNGYHGFYMEGNTVGASRNFVITDCNFVNMAFDCFALKNGVNGAVISNNTMDMAASITAAASASAGYGIVCTGDGGTTPFTNICNNVTITGNQFQNMYCAAVWGQYGANNITVSNNVINNCAATVIGATSLFTGAANSAAINFTYSTITGVVISGNTITACGNPIVLFGTTGHVTGNVYIGNAGVNYVSRGNAVTNVDTSQYAKYQIIEEQTNITALVKSLSNITGQSTNEGGAVVYSGQLAYNSNLWTACFCSPSSTIFNNGAMLVSVSFGVGFTGSTLPGCTMTISLSDFFGDQLGVLSTTTFTAPQTVNIVTDARTTITLPTPILIPAGSIRIDLTTPAAQLFDTRSGTVAFSVGPNNSVGNPGTEYDFLITVNQINASQIFSAGDQGNGIGQFVMGNNGSPFTQIRTYTTSGNFPNPVPANSEVLIGPFTATGVVTTDACFITSLIAVPAGLIISDAYANATNQITFKVSNNTILPYTAAGAYSIKVVAWT